MISIGELQRELPQLCERHRIAYVDAFGSVARGEQNTGSDVDLVIEFLEPRQEAISKRYFGFLHDLEDRCKTHIDVLTERSIKNPHLRRKIERDRVRIYG